MSGVNKDVKSEEKKLLTRLIIPEENSEKKDDPSPLDSVLRWEESSVRFCYCVFNKLF